MRACQRPAWPQPDHPGPVAWPYLLAAVTAPAPWTRRPILAGSSSRSTPPDRWALGDRAHQFVDERLRKATTLHRQEWRHRRLLPLPRRHLRHCPSIDPASPQVLPMGQPTHHQTTQMITLLPVDLRCRSRRVGRGGSRRQVARARSTVGAPSRPFAVQGWALG